MACNGNWVCFTCRIAARRPTWRQVTYLKPEVLGMEGKVKCQRCGSSMRFLGPTIKIPPKNKTKAWKELNLSIIKLRQDISEINHLEGVKQKHAIEKKIVELKSRSQNEERERLIKQFEVKLAKYN